MDSGRRGSLQPSTRRAGRCAPHGSRGFAAPACFRSKAAEAPDLREATAAGKRGEVHRKRKAPGRPPKAGRWHRSARSPAPIYAKLQNVVLKGPGIASEAPNAFCARPAPDSKRGGAGRNLKRYPYKIPPCKQPQENISISKNKSAAEHRSAW